jgi:plasmid maintenance system killer protein
MWINANMKVSFTSDKEEAKYTTEKLLIGVYGARQAKKIIQRLGELEAADTAQQLPQNCRFHEHNGKRQGLYSIDLVHPFRIIVLPTCKFKSWVEITGVQVIEVINPH